MNTVALLFCLVASALALPMPKRIQPFEHSRIVGGTPAEEGEFPSMVTIQMMGTFGNYHICGGSVINELTIVTSAVCLVGLDPNAIFAVAGETEFTVVTGHEQSIYVSSVVPHESYSDTIHKNDVGVVILASPLTMTDYVQPAVLPAAGTQTAAGTICTVTGWGSLSESGGYSSALQKVDVPVVSDDDCNESYGRGMVAKSMICAGELGKDACMFDSGSPLFCNGAQIGIVSWGYGCGRPNYPRVYTEVSYFVDWIQANTVTL